MLAVLHHRAVRNSLLSGASSETSFGCSRASGNMSSVRRGYSADWEAGVWAGSASMGADHLTGEDRHNYGHKMMPGWAASLAPWQTD